MNFTQLEYQAYLARSQAHRQPKPAAGVEVESDLHDEIIAECRRRGWIVIHSRMDRATTTAKGVCDFIIFADRGRVFLFECKSRIGKLTPEQKGFAMMADMLGFTVHVVRSYSEFAAIIQNQKEKQNEDDSCVSPG